MIHETDDDRLDQSLRDTFSDFDLPPSGHVWSGVEGRLLAQPGPPRQVPLLLLLPAAALVGVAVGWFLPHPTAAPPAAATTQVATRPATQPSHSVAALAQATTLATAGTQAFQVAPPTLVAAKPKERPTGGAVRSRLKNEQASPLPAQPAAATDHEEIAAPVAPTLSYTAAIAPEAMPPLTAPADATALPGNLPWQDTAGASAAITYARLPAQPGKENQRQEWRPEYRTPKHRLAERGLKLRRFRNNITKQWQHLFGPRRAARTTQPAS